MDTRAVCIFAAARSFIVHRQSEHTVHTLKHTTTKTITSLVGRRPARATTSGSAPLSALRSSVRSPTVSPLTASTHSPTLYGQQWPTPPDSRSRLRLPSIDAALCASHRPTLPPPVTDPLPRHPASHFHRTATLGSSTLFGCLSQLICSSRSEESLCNIFAASLPEASVRCCVAERSVGRTPRRVRSGLPSPRGHYHLCGG